MEALAQFLGFVPNIKRVEQSHKLWEIVCSVKRKKRKENNNKTKQRPWSRKTKTLSTHCQLHVETACMSGFINKDWIVKCNLIYIQSYLPVIA